ncbi:hypothetical protein [Limimaricola sp.]|uniref:hypothetical protein n=1 Tax=Limimaricola sp. TaxID=2211665 RepID=UPI00405A28E4
MHWIAPQAIIGIVVSGLLATFLALFGYDVLISPVGDVLRKDVSDLGKQVDEYTQRVEAVYQVLDDIEAKDPVLVSGENLTRRQNELAHRLEEIEGMLDLQPREVLTMNSLRAEIQGYKSELSLWNEHLTRETARSYNTVLVLIGGLFVSILFILITNHTNRGGQK